VHEAGHVLFSPFGELLEVAGGSITQVAAPILVALLFLRQREYFGIAVALAEPERSRHLHRRRAQPAPSAGQHGKW
jgi:hypothetical protein